MLRSDLYDYSDVYTGVKGMIDLLAAAANENNKSDEEVALKSNASSRSFTSKINSTLTDNLEDLDIVTSMYNLLEYNNNYSRTSRRCVELL